MTASAIRPPGHADEDHFEAAPGLPEPLPTGERLLWQGAPVWHRLAIDALHLRKLALYFGALLLLQGAVTLAGNGSLADALMASARLAPLAIVALGLLAVFAWLSSRATLYTITDRRIVMRIGIVLTVTYNLPFRQIAAATLRRHADGTGDIAVTLVEGPSRIAWAHLWPHARPWQLRRPQPSLRSVPDGAAVAALLAGALKAALAVDAAAPPPIATQPGPGSPLVTGGPAFDHGGARRPALA